ncbi:hypothetical protein [Bacillus sp. E(2018)]|uniref:hypothetical protein n=1 Tax=Bacillus sp. E(2018) TaxID=2502239 RepID=UPI0010F9AD4F|nr:hypothetical protein [Bacillus sp. E(2018)]
MEDNINQLIQVLERIQANIVILSIILFIFCLFLLSVVLNLFLKEFFRKFFKLWLKEKWVVRFWSLGFFIFFIVTILLSIGGINKFLPPKWLETFNILAVAGNLVGLFDLYFRGTRGKALSNLGFIFLCAVTFALIAAISFYSGDYSFVTDNLKDVYAILAISLVFLSKLVNSHYDLEQEIKRLEEMKTETKGKRGRINNLEKKVEQLSRIIKQLKQ